MPGNLQENIGNDSGGIEARINRLQPGEALDEQTRHHDQHDRKANLADNKEPSEQDPLPTGC